MKTDLKENRISDALLTSTADSLLDTIKAEPVPFEILDLAMQLQEKFAENEAAARANGDDSTAGGV